MTKLVASTLFALVLAACSSKAERPPPAAGETPVAAGSADPKAEAENIYNTRCTPCHGSTGAGDGAASASLNPKPRNFQDAAWQSGVDDAYIEKIVAYGGQAVGKSAAMPPNPDLADKKDVIDALRAKVRSFRQ